LQQEADLEEHDLIIPWPVVATVALLIAFAVLEAALIGRGATPLDRIMMIPSPQADPGTRLYLDDAAYLRAMLLSYLNRCLMGPIVASTIASVVLACAFVEKGASLRVLLAGFAGGTAHRKDLLRQGEILAGISIVLWVVQLLSRFAVRPHDIFHQTVPTELAVAPVAFWGALTHLSWAGGWFVLWRYLFACVFVGGVLFEIWYLLSYGVYATTIAASLVLGMAIFVCARWILENYDPSR
jgi:hypothetical protein